MARWHQQTIVGVFALTCLILLAVLVLMFGGGRTLLARTYDVQIRFAEAAEGVQDGQSVTLNGKRIGQTKSVEFWNPDNLGAGIRVVVAVDRDYTVPKAAHVEVASSIMGFGRPAIRVVIDDLSDAAVLPRDGQGTLEGRIIPMTDQVVPPEMQASLYRATDEIGKLAALLQPFAESLGKLIEPRPTEAVDLEGAMANLATVVERFDDFLKSLDVILGEEGNQDNLRQALANVKTMSDTGVEAVKRINTLAAEWQTLGAEARVIVRKAIGPVDAISVLLERLDQVLATLDRGEGSAGLFLNDNRLYEELLLSSQRLTLMLDDLREVLDIAKKGKLTIRPF